MRSGKWVWDLARIQQEGVTQDILELLHKRLEALQEDTRTILATAACIGSSFEAAKLAVAAGRSLSEVLQCMTIGMSEGLIVAVEDRHAASGPGPPSEHRQASQFRFLHDRIQQAAFDCIPDDAKKDFRLSDRPQIDGRLRPRRRARSPTRRAEQSELRLGADCRRGGKAARGAPQPGGGTQGPASARLSGCAWLHLGRVWVCLDKRAWRTGYDLAFELHSEALECEYLTANFERADQLFKTLIANARSKLDKARIYRTKILLDTSEERYEQAIKVGIKALQAVRCPLPQKTFEAASADRIDAGAPAHARPHSRKTSSRRRAWMIPKRWPSCASSSR